MKKILAAVVFLSITLTAAASSAFCGIDFDVNEDGQIGLEEAIFSLQVAAGMTPFPIAVCNDREANATIKNAYTAAMAYFTDNPAACVTYQNLIYAGLRHEEDIQVTVLQCLQEDLRISTEHVDGTKIYYINATGEITSTEKDR